MSKSPIEAASVPAETGKTIYPEAFAAVVEGRVKRKLGAQFDLTNFGVNLTTLAPGSASALMHYHSRQDEFIYVVEGTPTVRIDRDEFLLRPGDCVGFKAATRAGHQVINKSGHPASYLEIGDRTIGDEATFPDDDLKAEQGADGTWKLTRKNGEPY